MLMKSDVILKCVFGLLSGGGWRALSSEFGPTPEYPPNFRDHRCLWADPAGVVVGCWEISHETGGKGRLHLYWLLLVLIGWLP